MTIAVALVLVVLLVPSVYLYLLALASIRGIPTPPDRAPSHRFLIAIAAHDEAAVIAATVERLNALDYPPHLFEVHVVADHCADGTAAIARRAGAVVHERESGPRTGKGEALSWLFAGILDTDADAVVVFDADTRVDPEFLRIMDRRLAAGESAIQGQHVIRNPQSGWFSGLAWAMFLIDNRFQNQGRANLGLSAKHMGDSICFRSELLRRVGWGTGLTEDNQMRQALLLDGVRIAYAPQAKGLGEAPRSWGQARKQRMRWIGGVRKARREFRLRLLREGLRRRNAAILDGALQSYLPAYSSLVVIVAACVAAMLAVVRAGPTELPALLVWSWLLLLVALFIYPFLGLVLERAPLRAYLAIVSGPLFILWRVWLSLLARLGRRDIHWVRTQHGC